MEMSTPLCLRGPVSVGTFVAAKTGPGRKAARQRSTLIRSSQGAGGQQRTDLVEEFSDTEVLLCRRLGKEQASLGRVRLRLLSDANGHTQALRMHAGWVGGCEPCSAG